MTFCGSAKRAKVFHLQRVLTFYPFKSLLRDPVYEIKGWSMVIRPMVVSASATEVHLLIVDSPLARIDDPVLIAMTLIQEISDLLFQWLLGVAWLTLSIGFLYHDSTPCEG